ERLIKEEETITLPADGRDHTGSVVPAGRRNHLSRELAPRTRLMEVAATPSRSARSAITARLALPSSGAAVTAARSASPLHPPSSLRRHSSAPAAARARGAGSQGLGASSSVSALMS